MERLEKTLFTLFGILFFLTPLIFWPFTSEIFEFNKIIVTYVITLLIVCAWAIKSVYEEKFIFRRTIIDIPLAIFLVTQILSTVFSVDPRTSFLGYYSRFNGGLISSICYAVLYWAFVSNISFEKAKKLLLVLLASSVVVSIIGTLEHFGVNLTCSPVQIYNLSTNSEYSAKFNNMSTGDKWKALATTNCWVQDVKHRVFSTLGQPNWLGTFLAALIPLTWAFALQEKLKSKKYFLLTASSVLLFCVILFTKSRSSLLGFLFAAIIFWGLTIWKNKKAPIKSFIIQNSLILIFALVIGTQFTPNIQTILNTQTKAPVEKTVGPALEVGGTESGIIRQIVWKGAIKLWKAYPLLGSGVETFAYTYYQVRPIEHNLVSEWDFVYNKAHNEYLNFAANSGSLGIISYLFLIGTVVFMFLKSIFKSPVTDQRKLINTAVLAGYVSILVSNFFGFSVVVTQLELFIFPAIALIPINQKEMENMSKKYKDIEFSKIMLIFIIILVSFFTLLSIIKYWRADTFYAKSRDFSRRGDLAKSLENINQAIKLSPKEPLYYLERSVVYTDSAIALHNEEKEAEAIDLAKAADEQANMAQTLSPRNVNIKRSIFTMYIKLSVMDPNYLINAEKTLQEAIVYSPTNAKFLYNLALIYARVGQTEEALKVIQKTIELKSNYKDARLAHALILIEQGEIQKAKTELEYILTNIDPEDSMTKQTLEELK